MFKKNSFLNQCKQVMLTRFNVMLDLSIQWNSFNNKQEFTPKKRDVPSSLLF